MKKEILSTILIVIANCALYSQCLSNLLNNGEMQGIVGSGVTAEGWEEIGDPDIQDHINGVQTSGLLWYKPILPSSDSSTWQDLFVTERVFQKVSLEKGAIYRINYEYASHPLIQDAPNAILNLPIELKPSIWFDNDIIHTGPTTLIPNQWYQDCFIFNAAKEEIEIMLGHEENGYIGFDNICLEKIVDDLAIDTRTICIGDSIIVDVNSNGLDLSWSTSDSTSTISINKAGSYWVDISDECGTYREEFEVEVEDCGCKLYIPNTVCISTLDINNSFKVGTVCELVKYELQIFDRWGNNVFSSKDINESWDGNYGFENTLSGLYTYRLSYNFFDRDQVKFGTINLLR